MDDIETRKSATIGHNKAVTKPVNIDVLEIDEPTEEHSQGTSLSRRALLGTVALGGMLALTESERTLAH